jgi:arabinofuranosyltransferase
LKDSKPRRPAAVMVWISSALPVVFFGLVAYQRPWMSDDAFVSLRVLENIWAGHGPVFNQFERVEA